MEKIRFKNRDGLTLRGVFQQGKNNKIIIMCHGFRSNRSSRGRFDRLADTFLKYGYNVMRFDFGGCGESDDRTLSLEAEVDDLNTAIHYAVSRGFKEIALYGQSLGARVCLEAFTPSYIKSMILTGPGTGPVHYDWTEEFLPSQLKELKEKGFLKHAVNDPYREEIVISQQMLLDFHQFEQKQLLSNISCPVLIIHGDQGEEQLLMPLSKNGIKWLPKESIVEVIAGSDHSFMNHMDELEEKTVQWLHQYF